MGVTWAARWRVGSPERNVTVETGTSRRSSARAQHLAVGCAQGLALPRVVRQTRQWWCPATGLCSCPGLPRSAGPPEAVVTASILLS